MIDGYVHFILKSEKWLCNLMHVLSAIDNLGEDRQREYKNYRKQQCKTKY